MWRGRKARREALIKRAIRTGLETFATKIQRRYRANRAGRKTQQQSQLVHEQQLDKYARVVQRRYRAKRAATVARLIFAAKKRQREREVRAATQMQRRFRGLAGRKRFNLLRLQQQIREREEREASLRIQTIYRGRADRKKAQELQRQKERELEIRHQRATQLQAQFRRRKARKEADARRQAIRDRERAATTLQLAFRSRKARQTLTVMKMTSYHRECQAAARVIQKRWRTRKDRVGLALILDIRRQRGERQVQAAIFLQRIFRRFLTRQRARSVMFELLTLRQNDLDMETWAATLVQAHWRRIQAVRELERAQVAKRSRWKQLIDTHNQHGMGYGAPFYYVRYWMDVCERVLAAAFDADALLVCSTEPSEPGDPVADAARTARIRRSPRLRSMRCVEELELRGSQPATFILSLAATRATRLRECRVRDVRRVLLRCGRRAVRRAARCLRNQSINADANTNHVERSATRSSTAAAGVDSTRRADFSTSTASGATTATARSRPCGRPRSTRTTRAGTTSWPWRRRRTTKTCSGRSRSTSPW